MRSENKKISKFFYRSFVSIQQDQDGPQVVETHRLMLKHRSSSSRPDQPIRPCFARADELDVAGKAEGVELTLDGLEATPKLACDVRRSHLAGLTKERQDQLPSARRRPDPRCHNGHGVSSVADGYRGAEP